ncbi:hypothetical protein AB0K09_18315, partial [Streptomyces sp. NPDC049577]
PRAPARRVSGPACRAPRSGCGSCSTRTSSSSRGARTGLEWLALADPRAGSPAETVARLRMHDAGLYPETQVLLVAPSGRRAYPDFFFRAQGLVVEIEGYAWHGSRAQHQRDTARFNDLSACPEVRRILRFTAVDVFRRPDVMIRDICGALGVSPAPAPSSPRSR